jgi:predicted PurR-regulated permease PerM
VLLAITAGSLTLGILGAFLAVPVAAIVARILDDIREGPPPADVEAQAAAIAAGDTDH